MSKTILIGPTGFLGLSFLESNLDIIAIGRNKIPNNLKNKFIKLETTDNYSVLDDVDFDNVIFLIGSSDHEILNNHPTMAIEKNVLELSKFLYYLKNSNKVINKIITFTTMLQYDTKKMTLPCREEEARNPYINNYIFSKYIAEMLTQQYRDTFSIIDIRLSNVYGPTDLRRPDLVPTLIWKILDNIAKIEVWTKLPRRDFVFVQDVIDAVELLLDSKYSGPLNIGSGSMNSVGDVCDILSTLSNREIVDLNKIVTGHMEYYHDLTLVKSIINWEPKYSLQNGLKITYEKMTENIKKEN